jgi:tetratricopeptide (TPR) repeat protein
MLAKLTLLFEYRIGSLPYFGANVHWNLMGERTEQTFEPQSALKPRKRATAFPVIGLGAAAGGLQALKGLQAHLLRTVEQAIIATDLDGIVIYWNQFAERRQAEANKQYESFESLEQENVVAENSWHHMINYWLDHDKNLKVALEHAQREYDSRKDLFTCDAFAWALFKNGRLPEARRVIQEALRTGSRDARLLYHSGMIANALGERGDAVRDLQLALKLKPTFNLRQAQIARNTLDSLAGGQQQGLAFNQLFSQKLLNF